MQERQWLRNLTEYEQRWGSMLARQPDSRHLHHQYRFLIDWQEQDVR